MSDIFKELVITLSNQLRLVRSTHSANQNNNECGEEIMFGNGVSISFGSVQSSAYWQTHPEGLPSYPLNAFSDYDLQKNTSIKMDGSKTSLGANVEVVCLLQAAEIERLSANLEDYRLREKQSGHRSLDRHSYEIQVKQLTQIAEQLRLQNSKIKEYCSKLNEEVQLSRNSGTAVEKKYCKSLLQIDALLKQNTEIMDKNSQLEDMLMQLRNSMDQFEKSKIKEVQVLRQQFNREKQEELTYETSRLSSQKDLIDNLLTNQKQAYRRLKEENDNINREIVAIKNENIKLETVLRKLDAEKNNSISLAEREIQRLRILIEQQNGELHRYEITQTEINVHVNNFRKQIQSLKANLGKEIGRRQGYEEQITQKNIELANGSKYVSQLQQKVQTLIANVKERNSKLKEKDEQILQLQLQCETNKKTQYELTHKVEDMIMLKQTMLNEINAKKEEIRGVINNCQGRLRYQQQDIISYKHENQQLKQSISAEQIQRKQLVSQLQACKRELQRTAKEAKENSVHKEQILRQDIEAIKLRECEKLAFSQKKAALFQQRAAKYQQQLKKYIETNNQSENNSNLLRAQLQAAERQLKRMQATELTRQQSQQSNQQPFKELMSEVERLHEQVLAKNQDNDRLVIEVQRLAATITQLNKEISGCRQMIKKLSTQNAQRDLTRKEEHIIIANEINKLKKEAISKLDYADEQTKELQRAVSAQQLLSVWHNSICEQFKRELQTKEEQIKSLRQELQQKSIVKSKQMINNEISDILAKIVALTRQNAELKWTLSKAVTDNENKTEHYTKKQQQLLQQINELQAKIYRQQSIVKQQVTSLQLLETNLQAERKKNLTLQTTIRERQSDTEREQTIQVTLRAQISSLQSSSLQKQRELEQITQRGLMDREKATKERLKLENTIDQQQQLLHHQDNMLQQIKKELDLTETRMKDQLNVLSRNVVNLQRQNQQLQSAFKQCIETNEKLKANEAKMLKEMVSASQAMLQQNERLDQQCESTKREAQRVRELQQRLEQCKGIIEDYNDLQLQMQQVQLQNDLYRRKEENKDKIISNYEDKVIILTEEFERLQLLVEKLQSQNYHLKSVNYDFSVEVEKCKISTQKINVLNQEIDRMTHLNLGLVEEVQLCRLEISGDSLAQREKIQHLSLFVVLFAQVESLRSRLAQKEHEVLEVRKSFVKNTLSIGR